MSKVDTEEIQVIHLDPVGVKKAVQTRLPALKTVAANGLESSLNVDISSRTISAAGSKSMSDDLAHFAPLAVFASYMSGGLIHVGLDNHCAFVFPAHRVEALARARAIELRQIWIESQGQELYWPRLLVRLSLPLLMHGVFGSPDWMCEQSRRLAMTSGQGNTAMRKARVPMSVPIA